MRQSMSFRYRVRRWDLSKKLGIAATIGAGAMMWAVAFALMAGIEIVNFPFE